jgi:hypothetical protein
MKTSFRQVTLVALALGTTGVTAALAQTPTPVSPATTQAATTPGLTADEKAQLKKDRDQVLAANPDLKTEEDNLTKQHDALKSQGESASADDKKALHAQMHAHMDKIRAAVLKIDPTAAPLYAKLDALHKSHQP